MPLVVCGVGVRQIMHHPNPRHYTCTWFNEGLYRHFLKWILDLVVASWRPYCRKSRGSLEITAACTQRHALSQLVSGALPGPARATRCGSTQAAAADASQSGRVCGFKPG